VVVDQLEKILVLLQLLPKQVVVKLFARIIATDLV